MSNPDPMTPANCDLRGMPYMPLDIVRLFDSDLYALSTGEEFKAALSLWGKAFLQVPAASVPNDDRILAHLSGAGARWPKVRDMALRGWVLCSDGRLYHPVVAEKARDAWQARIDRRCRTEAARKARQEARVATSPDETEPPMQPATERTQHNVTRLVTSSVTENVTNDVAQNVTGSKGSTRERESKVKKEEDNRSLRSLPQNRSADGFDEWWSVYPRKVAKDGARKAYASAIKRGASPLGLLKALDKQRWNPNPQYIPYPASWLNGGCWQDDPDAAAPPEPVLGVWDQVRMNLDLSSPTIDEEGFPYARTH